MRRHWYSYTFRRSILLEGSAEPVPVCDPWDYEATVSIVNRTGQVELRTVCCGPAAPYPALSTTWTEQARDRRLPVAGALSICGAPGERGPCELDWRHNALPDPGDRKHAITLPSGRLTFRW